MFIRVVSIFFFLIFLQSKSQEIYIEKEFLGDDPFLKKTNFFIDKPSLDMSNDRINNIDTLLVFLNSINSVKIDDFRINDFPDRFEINLHQYKNNQLNLFKENYFYSYMSEEFKNMWNDYVFYNYHNFLCQYVLINKKTENLFEYNTIPYFLSEDVYFESINKNYQFPIFKNYIYNMTFFLVTQKKNNKTIKSFFNEFVDFSKNHLNEELFVYCVSRFVSDYIIYIDNVFFNTILNNMSSYDDFSFFKSYLIEKHEINQKNIQDHEDLEKNSNYSKHDFYLENLNKEMSSLDNYLGKVLYIDIWASWCGPCRKQFSYSKELKKKIKKKYLKKIKFIYISIDNDYEKWESAIEKLEIEGEHFISPANKLNNAGMYFNVQGIPRYIIIDKNGNILDPNAKRPSDEDIVDYLISFLK